MNAQVKTLIWLNRICGFVTPRMHRILSLCGEQDLRKAFPNLRREITDRFGADTAAVMADTYDDEGLLNREIEALERAKIKLVSIYNAEYPDLLKEIACPPLLLYCKGDIGLLKTRCIGIVGSRSPSRYGLDVTTTFAAALSQCGLTVVSGLARGIDSQAHRAVLDVSGKTIAVLGCGIDRVYPADNSALYKRIEDEGLIISEYGLGVPPNSFQFPERNRIISGLSEGVLVTEAGLKSGSLLTANDAISQNRELFAIPSNITSVRGMGTNKLIREYPHCAVFSPDDIAERLRISGHTQPASVMQLDFIEEKLVEALGFTELNFEELIQISGLGISDLNAVLTKLELLGIIKKLDNNYYGV
ncbi:MAG TPA: DNA-processing protein DprA [Clostridia bacterium]|jgi:DNA processing protein|nr:DNA-processing protein DprA [Clostridia bacterium]HOL60410.1 DNA-processing protein DprA [Clostridia bacterium]HPO53167.1 DNA-processing protein DprA [Clostridia bacterium]